MTTISKPLIPEGIIDSVEEFAERVVNVQASDYGIQRGHMATVDEIAAGDKVLVVMLGGEMVVMLPTIKGLEGFQNDLKCSQIVVR